MTKPGRTNWSEAENVAIVASYLSMLKLELAGKPFTKSRENARLREDLHARSHRSVEFKYQNISAVLLENGWIYIKGYKPAPNLQKSLRDEVERQLRGDSELDALMERHIKTLTEATASAKADMDVVAPPTLVLGTAEWRPREIGIKRDYAYRDAKNRQLGLNGELAVVSFEKKRLSSLGHGDLASRVTHSSATRGDGLGYDVQSFGVDGGEHFIEVKTTVYGREVPFFISRYEVAASDYFGERFSLYRLFQFGSRYQGMYQLRGSLSHSCELRAET